ncbi:SpoIIE family protein phosphatase [Trebonia sp.]|uniref:ATP-binding SpoIIE family protein phosphatase n=1 Tax=Trebonia sp. TaxID=2767075 RepID=UPI00263198C5|nr:SpoIIE family protein phosphatase [Trebonia sp.]
MTRWNEGAFGSYVPAELVLRQAEIGVILADRQGNVRFANEYVPKLLRLRGPDCDLAGKPIHALGFMPDGDLAKAEDLSRQVLGGMSWEGTFTGTRGDGSLVFVRVLAVPWRRPSGDIDGMVVMLTTAGRRDAQREQDRLRLLERVGERLAGSLELDATLRQVAQILVPQFADHCFIDLFSGDKLIRRAQTHAGGWEPPPGTWACVGEPIHYPPGHFMQQAMARLETIVVPDLHAEYYPAPSEESMSAADQAGLTSVLASPLYARGELLGVMSLALSRLTDRPDPHYDLSDGDLIGAIASRVAVAIDNAMLFEAERQTALAFQQSLLPQEVPELDGLEVAFRYVPAKPLETQGQGIQTQVGGDWYDIIPLAAGRVGMVIGDVEGRGPRAAATMGQLRAALRAYAQDEKAPADIMRKLDEWVRSTAPVGAGGDPPTVSCIYLIYDAWSRELTFANAGHAAPLLAAGGLVRPLEVRHKGVLLGVRGRGIRGLPTYKEQTVKLPPGAALVLYTDGLTDRRTRADGSGHYTEAEAVAMLRDAILAAAGSGAADTGGRATGTGVASALALAAENAVPGDIDDDMAILVLRSSPADLASVARTFPAEPIMVSEARRLAAATFASWHMDPEQADLACLLVSEVVTNAVLHAAGTPSPAGRRLEVEIDPLVPVAAQVPAALSSAWPAAVSAIAAQAWENPVGHQAAPHRPREFALRLRRGAEVVWAEVFDPDLRLPRLRTARATDEGGRGLYLVEQLATRWGSRPTPEGKAVWFEIPLDGKDG